MLNKILLLAAVSVALFTGCLGDFFNLQNDPLPEAWELPPSKFAQCAAAEYEHIDPALYVAATFQHAPEPGLTVHEEVPVSPKGCVRYYQDIKDGKLVSIGVVRAEGVVEVYNAPDGTVAFREHEMFLHRETFTETTNTIEIDAEGDGRVESMMTASYDQEGLKEQVITFFAASNGQISERRVLQRIDANTIRWTEENRVAGELVKTRDQQAPAEMNWNQEQEMGCYVSGDKRSSRCSSEELQKINRLLAEMLKKASECLSRRQERPTNSSAPNDSEMLQHIVKTRASKLVRICFTGGGAHGSMHPLRSEGPFGYQVLSMNVGTLECQSENFVQATLFHEVLHITRGPHEYDRDLRDLADDKKLSEEAYRYTDSIRACASFCFEELKNKCSCAACFGVKTCNDLCRDEPSCTQRDLSGQGVMSQAVGALCIPKNPWGQKSWHSTMESCRQSCGDGQCKSYSLSCDTNCN
jgi:hypothetical protein